MSFRPIWLCVLSLVFATSHAVPAEPPDGAREFVRAVLARHPSVRKAVELVRAAEFEVKANGLQPNPNLTLAATLGDAGESSNALTQRFELAGQPGLRRSIAAARLQAARLESASARRRVAASAYRAWLELWKTYHLHEIADLRQRLMGEMKNVARRRFEVGEIAENESLRVDLAASQAQSNEIRAAADLLSARRQASLLLGESVGDAVLHMPVSLLEEVSLEQALASVAEHPEVLAGYLQVEALQQGVELIRKERAPDLALSAYRSHLFRTSSVEQGVQLSLSWPIFDWGSIRYRARQQEQKVQAYRSGIEESLLEQRIAVSKTWTSLQAARENRQVLAIQAERYEELAREARIAYDVGFVSLTDVLQTESSFRLARVQLLQAEAEVLELEAELLERTGLPWPEGFLQEDL